MTDDGQMQLTLSDGINIIQTTMATEQLQSRATMFTLVNGSVT